MNEIAKSDKNYNKTALAVTADVNQEIVNFKSNAAGDAMLVELVGGGTAGVQSVTGVSPIDVDNTDPSNPVISFIQEGTVVVRSVSSVAVANLTYNNGASGVGATITKTSGAFVPSDFGLIVFPPIGSKILFRALTMGASRGVYVYSGSTTVMVRSTDSDTDSELDGQIVYNQAANNQYLQSASPVTVGTTTLIYNTQALSFVTQSATGSQVNGQIPTWNSTARQLTKGSSALTWLNSVLSVNGTLKQGLTFASDYYKVESSSDLLGIGLPGSGIYASSNPTVDTSIPGAAFITVNFGGVFVCQMTSYTSAYEVVATNNGDDGILSYTTTDKATGANSGLYAEVNDITFVSASDNNGKVLQTILSIPNATSITHNNANTNKAIYSNLENGVPQQTALNYNPGAYSLTSTFTLNGSFASNSVYLSTSYTIDTNNSLTPDNNVVFLTTGAGVPLNVTMPLAVDFIDREITIFNLATEFPINAIRVIFPGSDFENGLSSNYINETLYQSRTYKAVRNVLGDVIWVIKGTNKTSDGYKFFDYGVTVTASTGDNITYGVGLPTTSGATTVDIGSNSDIPLGTKVIVKDIGLNAFVDNITIDAGTDLIYGDPTVTQPTVSTILIDKNGQSVTLQKTDIPTIGIVWLVI